MSTAPAPRRGELSLADLDKRRPVVVLTRDPLGRHLHAVIIGPVTSTIRGLSTEVEEWYGSRRRQPEGCLPIAVLAAQAAGVEPDRTSGEVIAEAESPKPEPVLPLSRLHVLELDDVVPAGSVGRVGPEDGQELLAQRQELGVALGEGPEVALEPGGAEDGEAWGTTGRSLRLRQAPSPARRRTPRSAVPCPPRTGGGSRRWPP